MNKKSFSKIQFLLVSLAIILAGFLGIKTDVYAVSIPGITLSYDSTDQSVIVAGIPAYDSTGSVQYELNGYINYSDERIGTFCYAPSVAPHHIPEKQAYVFNWADTEFLLPCSGEYQFTAYVCAIYSNGNGMVKEKGPSQTITITLTKKDESTNWGPGLPNTTVESYDLGQIQGKDKTILVEEDGYTWTINGSDIETVPEKNISLAITKDSNTFPMENIETFFGDTLVSKFTVDHSGNFGFSALLKYFVGNDYIGKYANLFYVNGDGTFDFIEGCLVDENGFASYIFTHASDYVIAITDAEYTGQELNPAPEVPDTGEEVTLEDSLDTEDTSLDTAKEPATSTPAEDLSPAGTPSYIWIILAVIILITIICSILLIKKKKK